MTVKELIIWLLNQDLNSSVTHLRMLRGDKMIDYLYVDGESTVL